MLLLLLFAVLTATAAEHSRRYLPLRPLPAVDNGLAATRSGASTVYVGEKRQLVFLVSFSDLTYREAAPLMFWNKVFNQPDFQESPFYGSVHDYFYAQSRTLFNLQFDLHHVQLNAPHADYASGYIGMMPDDSRTGLLLTHILDRVKGEITDWSVYDWDSNGVIDQVLIFFPGKGQNDGGGNNTIWSHQWSLSVQADTPWEREWGKPYTVTSNGRQYIVDNYGAFPELSGANDYGTFGTLCHEYGHCLGLPDFYYGSNTKVVGDWDIMDHGNYNKGGFCPPNYSAHERMVLGWQTPTELTTTTTVSDMDASQAYLIRNDGYSDEFYIVENRQQTGWDQSLPGSGVVVFHIDYDEKIWREETPNSSSKKRYRIIPANNKTSSDYAYWAYPYLTNDSLTNQSSPAATLNNANTDGSKLMNKSIRDIKVENRLASFRFTVDTKTCITELPVNRQSQILYDLGPIYIIRYANGDIKKVMKR